MVHTPLLPLILLLVHTNSATLDDVDEGSGIAVDSSRISGSAIMENDRKITEPFLSSPPISTSLQFNMDPVMVETEQAHNYATTVTEDARVLKEQAGNMNQLTKYTKIQKRIGMATSNRTNQNSQSVSDVLDETKKLTLVDLSTMPSAYQASQSSTKNSPTLQVSTASTVVRSSVAGSLTTENKEFSREGTTTSVYKSTKGITADFDDNALDETKTSTIVSTVKSFTPEDAIISTESVELTPIFNTVTPHMTQTAGTEIYNSTLVTETSVNEIANVTQNSSESQRPKVESRLPNNTLTTITFQEASATDTEVTRGDVTTESSGEASTVLNTFEPVIPAIDLETDLEESTVKYRPVPMDLTTLIATPSFIEDEKPNAIPSPDDAIHITVTTTEPQIEVTDLGITTTTTVTEPVDKTRKPSQLITTTVTKAVKEATRPSELITTTVTEAVKEFTGPSRLSTDPVNESTKPQLRTTSVTELVNETIQPSQLTTTPVTEPVNESTKHSQLRTTTDTKLVNESTQPSQLTTTPATESINKSTLPSHFKTITDNELVNGSTKLSQSYQLTTTPVTEPGNESTKPSQLRTTTDAELVNGSTQSSQSSQLTTTPVNEPVNKSTLPFPLRTTTDTELLDGFTQPSQLATTTVTEPVNKTTQHSPLTTTAVTETVNKTTQPSQSTTTADTEPVNGSTQPSQFTTETVTEPVSIANQPSQITAEAVNQSTQLTTKIVTQPSKITTTIGTKTVNRSTQPSRLTTEPVHESTQSPPLTTIAMTEPINVATQSSQLPTTTDNDPVDISTQPSQLTAEAFIEPVNITTQLSQISMLATEQVNKSTQPSPLTTINGPTQPSQSTATTDNDPVNISTQPSHLTAEALTESVNITTQTSQIATIMANEPVNKSTQPSSLTTTNLPSTEITESETGSTTLAFQASTKTTIIENKESEDTTLASSTSAPNDTTLVDASNYSFSTNQNIFLSSTLSPLLEQSTMDLSTLNRIANASFDESGLSTENQSVDKSIDFKGEITSVDQSTEFIGESTTVDQSTELIDESTSARLLSDNDSLISTTGESTTVDQSTELIDESTSARLISDNDSLISTTTRNTNQVCETHRGPDPGRSCIFPFWYHGKIFFGCTYSGDINDAWCSTEVDQQNRYIKNRWGYCNDDCPKDKSLCVTTGPSGKEGLPCLFPFHYMHMMFWSCTSLPSPGTGESRPWCPTALDDHMDVLNDNWGYCSRKCLGSGDILIESPLYRDTSSFDEQEEVSTSLISTSVQTQTAAFQASTAELVMKTTEKSTGNTNLTEMPVNTNLTKNSLGNTNVTEMTISNVNVTEISDVNLDITEMPFENATVTEIIYSNLNATEMPFENVNVTEIPPENVNATEVPSENVNVTEIQFENINATEMTAASTHLSERTTDSHQQKNDTDIVEIVTEDYEINRNTTPISKNVTNMPIENTTQIEIISTSKNQDKAFTTESLGTTFSDQTQSPDQVSDVVTISTTSLQMASTEKAIRSCGKAGQMPPQDSVIYLPNGCWDPVLDFLER